jgi:TATA-box binding protein (TBP) (component of TFIID and TFIIIB)
MAELENEWMQYLTMQHTEKTTGFSSETTHIKRVSNDIDGPSVGKINHDMELFISTKTKVLFLNHIVDIHNLFWKIPVIDYWNPVIGVLKKQIKVVSKTPEEFEIYKSRLTEIRFYKENIIKQINNPAARSIKFKDERKITVGISKKDILSYRGKVKNAFYNCFALIVRFQRETEPFREVHIKVFNTGKMEIPGIVHYQDLEKVKQIVLDILQPYVSEPLCFLENSNEDHVLINSNFNCGFFVNREKIHSILKGDAYGIESSYDPCSYPGVKCKFYYNNSIGFDPILQNGRIMAEDQGMKMNELLDCKKYTEVSFMIFRTGSGLIVGNCTERILRFIFEFIKKLLITEYDHICILSENPVIKNKRPKMRKRNITYTTDYFENNIHHI